MPASTLTGPYGPNLPPSANSAPCARGDHTGEIGVIGRVQQHLITSFFHARPRPRIPANQTVALHASQQARLAGSAAACLPSKLPTLQNQPAKAEAKPRTNSTAALLPASPPQSEQRAAHNPASRPSGEASSSTEPDVPTQTDHGRQGDRDLVPHLAHRPLGRWIVSGSRSAPTADPGMHVCLPQGLVPENNLRQALVPPPVPPDPSDHVPSAAPIDVHGHQHGDRNCSNLQPCDRLPG